MNFSQSIKDAWNVLILDSHTMTRVAHEQGSFSSAMKLVASVGLALGILASLFMLLFMGPFALLFLIVVPIGLLLGSFIGIGILHILALMFGGRATYKQFYSVSALTTLSNVASIIPFVSWLVTIWQIVANVFILKNVHHLSTGRAVAVVLIPIGIAVLLMIMMFAFMAAAFGGLFLGGLGGGY